MKKNSAILVFFVLLMTATLTAQVNDTLRSSETYVSQDTAALTKTEKKKVYSGPRRAALLSAVVPGLGQAYNKKYWKIPLIYAGLGGLGYMFVLNNNQYNFYRKNLIAENDGNPSTVNETRYSSDQLQYQKVYYRKNRDFAAIGMALIYLFNLIDANVDAHLKTFDVSDDLSLHIDPWQQMMSSPAGFRTAGGISLKINFN